MYTVYVLYSPTFSKIYVGFSSDFEKRLISHNQLGTKGWSIRYRPWEVLFTEEYPSKQEAMKRISPKSWGLAIFYVTVEILCKSYEVVGAIPKFINIL